MATRLSTYLDNFALLSPAQFGFQRGKSTYMALLEVQTCISEAMNFDKYSLGVFFDISKAFDTVNHTLQSLLINKLEHYGIRGIAKQWFIDYLNKRKQYVFLKEAISSCMKITSGVPQGSKLGPIYYFSFTSTT